MQTQLQKHHRELSRSIRTMAEAGSTMEIVADVLEAEGKINTENLVWTARGAAELVRKMSYDVGEVRDDIEEKIQGKISVDAKPININPARTSDIKHNTTKLFVLLSALQRINGSRKYYSEIGFLEDVPHNMETLFDELDALHGMIFEEVVELEEKSGVRK